MTTPLLLADLMRDEGLRLTAYQDGGGVWTIGYGHTGPGVREGLVWSLYEAQAALEADVAAAEHGLTEDLPWWRSLDDVRQDVLVEMAFNLGVGGLMEFGHLLSAAQCEAWASAASDMLASRWADQVGARATRLARMMLTGARP